MHNCNRETWIKPQHIRLTPGLLSDYLITVMRLTDAVNVSKESSRAVFRSDIGFVIYRPFGCISRFLSCVFVVSRH